MKPECEAIKENVTSNFLLVYLLLEKTTPTKKKKRSKHP